MMVNFGPMCKVSCNDNACTEDSAWVEEAGYEANCGC